MRREPHKSTKRERRAEFMAGLKGHWEIGAKLKRVRRGKQKGSDAVERVPTGV